MSQNQKLRQRSATKQRIVQHVRDGIALTTAAQHVGVSPSTVTRWRKKDKTFDSRLRAIKDINHEELQNLSDQTREMAYAKTSDSKIPAEMQRDFFKHMLQWDRGARSLRGRPNREALLEMSNQMRELGHLATYDAEQMENAGEDEHSLQEQERQWTERAEGHYALAHEISAANNDKWNRPAMEQTVLSTAAFAVARGYRRTAALHAQD